ncbi:MAG: MerR family transcriptional regulator [Gaiellaceae bacterium]|jgi:DNA-binding transcriptional MerR regulator
MEGERDNLVPIGRFAFLTGLSRRALRFYDERELLRPASVDEWTGYRYYSLDQMAAADTIRELREVDLPLDEVRQALLDPTRLDELLDRHEARLRERVAESEQALALLRKLREKKEEPVTLSIELREVPELRAACVEMHTALDRIGPDCGQAIGRLMTAFGSAGVAPIGPNLIGYPEEDFDPESFVALIGFPVASDLPVESGLKMVDFSGGKAAVGMLIGHYDGLSQAWRDVHTWISEQGLQIRTMPYELYRVGHMETASPAEFETDIVVPVA